MAGLVQFLCIPCSTFMGFSDCFLFVCVCVCVTVRVCVCVCVTVFSEIYFAPN